jgi:hypothetical protein
MFALRNIQINKGKAGRAGKIRGNRVLWLNSPGKIGVGGESGVTAQYVKINILNTQFY